MQTKSIIVTEVCRDQARRLAGHLTARGAGRFSIGAAVGLAVMLALIEIEAKADKKNRRK